MHAYSRQFIQNKDQSLKHTFSLKITHITQETQISWTKKLKKKNPTLNTIKWLVLRKSMPQDKSLFWFYCLGKSNCTIHVQGWVDNQNDITASVYNVLLKRRDEGGCSTVMVTSHLYCIYVMRYSRRHLRTLATSYWLGINTIQHKGAVVYSSQEVQYRM